MERVSAVPLIESVMNSPLRVTVTSLGDTPSPITTVSTSSPSGSRSSITS